MVADSPKETKCLRCVNGDTRTADGFHLMSTGKYKRCADLPPYEEPAAPTSKTVTLPRVTAMGRQLEATEPDYMAYYTSYEIARDALVSKDREIERLRAALERYGRHEHPNCHDLTLKEDGSFGARNGCLCGFDAVNGGRSPDETKPRLSEDQANVIATDVVQNVCELPGYTSPDDNPALVSCTVTELHHCVMLAVEAFNAGSPEEPSEDLTSRQHAARNALQGCTCGSDGNLHHFGCQLRREGDDGKGAVKSRTPLRDSDAAFNLGVLPTEQPEKASELATVRAFGTTIDPENGDGV